MYKFNGGQGAIICNLCRVIILEPAELPLQPSENMFHICNKCKPDWYNKLYMEDVHDISLKAIDTIESEFLKRGFEIDKDIVDDIYETISDKIEHYTHSEYRHHN